MTALIEAAAKAMTREQLIETMARAASESFKARISKSAEMSFAETGVSEPSMAVFCDYATAILSAIEAAGLELTFRDGSKLGGK